MSVQVQNQTRSHVKIKHLEFDKLAGNPELVPKNIFIFCISSDYSFNCDFDDTTCGYRLKGEDLSVVHAPFQTSNGFTIPAYSESNGNLCTLQSFACNKSDISVFLRYSPNN